MGDTPIESLIIELKLKADELTDSAAEKALNNIRSAVQALNEDLKAAEASLSAIGTKFGGFGNKAGVREKSVEPTPVAAPATAVTPPVPTAPSAPVPAATTPAPVSTKQGKEWAAQSKQLERDFRADELRKKRAADRAHALNLRRIDQIANKEAREEQRRVAISAKAAQDVIDEEERAGKRAELLKFKAKTEEIKERDAGDAKVRAAAESLATDLKAVGVDTEARKRGISRETDAGRLTAMRGKLEDELATVGDQIKAGLVDPERGKARQESLAGLIEHTKGLEDTAKREERANAKQRKMPTSLKGLIGGMEGLGPIAAGVYLFKSAISAITGALSGLASATETSQNVKQLGEEIGLTSAQLEGFRAIAIQVGDTQGTVVKDLERLGKEWTSVIPGYIHAGLNRMQISVMDSSGNRRKFADVLNELSDKASKDKRVAEEMYAYFRQLGIAGKQLTDVLKMGPKKIESERRKDVLTGVAKSDWQVQFEAETWVEVTTAMRVAGNAASLFGAGLWKIVKFLTTSTPLGGVGAVAWQAKNLIYGSGNESEQIKVTPQSVRQFSNDRRTPEAMGSGFKIDQMNVNVRVDKDGRATASVDGVKPSRVTTNVAPWAGVR
jgi:hypothetical protein